MGTQHAYAPQIRNDVRLRLTRRGRIVVILAISSLLLAGALVAAFFLGTPSAAAGEETSLQYATVTVTPGDTLWDLVTPHVPEGQDVRDYLLLVEEINDLESSSVRPGQVISLPVQ